MNVGRAVGVEVGVAVGQATLVNLHVPGLLQSHSDTLHASVVLQVISLLTHAPAWHVNTEQQVAEAELPGLQLSPSGELLISSVQAGLEEELLLQMFLIYWQSFPGAGRLGAHSPLSATLPPLGRAHVVLI